MRRSLPLLLLLLSGIFAPFNSGAKVPFNGKSGVVLRNSLCENYRPQHIVSPERISMNIYDPFDGVTVIVSSGVLPEGYSWGTLVPSDWWKYSPDKDAVEADLFNRFPLNKNVVEYRKDLTPGMVTEPVYSNKYWKAGKGVIFGTLTELYSPPEEFKGELARTYFYMAIMYPSSIWTPRGFMMMDTNTYPVFNSYAKAMLMEWHKSYPVNDNERIKNNIVEGLQGNRNPFIDFPDLPEYLWGDYAGDSYIVPGEPMPLRGVYTLDDERIDLISPHVPSDAIWTIDGLPAQSSTYTPVELGVGKHNLKYRSPSTGESGYLMITINHK